MLRIETKARILPSAKEMEGNGRDIALRSINPVVEGIFCHPNA
jgi:hypothetical protein